MRGGGWEDNDGDIPDWRCKAVGVGQCDIERRTFSGGLRYSTAAANVDKDGDRGGTALPTPPSAATLQETTTTTTMTTMATTIALPTTIKSMGAAMVLVPHGAKLPPPPPLPAMDSPALSANTPTHASLNATNTPLYVSLFLVKDGGMTAQRHCCH